MGPGILEPFVGANGSFPRNRPWIALLYLAIMFFGVFVTLSAIKFWTGKVPLLEFGPFGGTIGILLCATLTHILPKRWTSSSASHDNHPDDDIGRPLRGLEETPAGDGGV